MTEKRIDFLGYSNRGGYRALFCTFSPLGRPCLTQAYRYTFLGHSL